MKPTSATALSIHNEAIKLSVDRCNGALVELVDLRAKHDYIERPDLARIARLVIPSDSWPGRNIDLHLLPAKVETCGSDCIRISYPRLLDTQGQPVAGQVHISLSLQMPDRIRGSIELAGVEEPVVEVFFPWLGGLGPAEHPDQDIIMMPSTWQRLIRQPLRTLPKERLGWNQRGAKRSWRYPVNLVTGWTDYGGPNRGLALDSRDASGEPQDIYIERQPEMTDKGLRANVLSLAWVYHPHRGCWQSADTYLHLHQGDWHTPARDHRDWALQHFRPADTPARYLASIGWQFLFMRHQDGKVNYTYSDLPEIARKSLACGIPNLLIFGWFEGGHDARFPEYQPVAEWGGEPALREAVKKIRELGGNPILYMNPTIWDCQTEAYRSYGPGWSAKSRTTSEYRESYAWSNTEASVSDLARSFAVMCPIDQLNAFTLETVKRIVGYGGPSLHFDQMVRAFLCYDEDHGHSLPQRAAIDGYASFLPAVRKILKKTNPEAVLSLEGMSEYHCQYGDSCWNWSQLADCESIRLSLPLTPYSHELEAGETADVNRCFVKGLLMDFRIDGGDGLVADYPEFAEHVGKVAALKQRLPAWLHRSLFEDRLGLSLGHKHLCGASYRAEDGQQAAFLVANCSSRTIRARLRLDWQQLGVKPATVTRIDLDQEPLTTGPITSVEEDWPPYHIAVLIADKSAAG